MPFKGVVSRETQRFGELGMAEWVNQIGNVVAKVSYENGVPIVWLDRLTFVDRVTNPTVMLPQVHWSRHLSA